MLAVAVHPACGSTRPATRSRKTGLVCPGVSEHVRREKSAILEISFQNENVRFRFFSEKMGNLHHKRSR